MTQRRSRFEIIFDILSAIQAKQGRIKPTHLLYKSNLSHAKMKEYLKELISRGMVSEAEEKSKKFYTITDQGLTFLSEYKRIKEFSDTFGL